MASAMRSIEEISAAADSSPSIWATSGATGWTFTTLAFQGVGEHAVGQVCRPLRPRPRIKIDPVEVGPVHLRWRRHLGSIEHMFDTAALR